MTFSPRQPGGSQNAKRMDAFAEAFASGPGEQMLRRDGATGSGPTRPATPGGSLVVWDANPLSLLATAGALHTAGHRCVCARHDRAAMEALSMTTQDAVVVDVGDRTPEVLETIERMRQVDGYEGLPVIMIATPQWSGLERKAEAMEATTRCLFKPIDPGSLLAVVESILWMPALVRSHRRRGTRPARSGWVTL